MKTMKSARMMIITIGILVTALLSPAAGGGFDLADGLTMDGSVRWRVELDDKDFVSGTTWLERPYLRTRVGLNFTRIEDTQVYIQIQDSRMLGDYTNTLDNDMNFGLHQGFIKTNFSDNCYLQVGRFEVSYGRQRLIGTVGWHNVGRSFDGFRAGYYNENFALDLFSLKLEDRSFAPANSHQDKILYGVYANKPDKGADLFFLYELDQMKNFNGDAALARFTVGTHVGRPCKLLDNTSIELDAAYQGGKEFENSISAFMIAFEATKKFEDFPIDKAAIGLDITSGDDDTSDDKIKWFDNLYYTGHKFRGFMDFPFFIFPHDDGLMDLFAKCGFGLFSDIDMMADFHFFKTMANYQIDPDSAETKSVGMEIDLTANKQVQENLTFQAGASVFYASDDAALWHFGAPMNVNDPAYWLYFMITAGL